jgi:TolB-like protein
MTLPTPERWAEIERLLDVVLALAPEDRRRCLERACTHDPALRAEVERLLGACEAAGPFLEEPALVAVAPVVTSAAVDETLEPGDRLGPYEIVRELGRGGMAVVYLAQDHKHHRPVALKILRPDLAVALGSQRFLREIQIAASLAHPHILPLYDSGEADWRLYFVMPFVEGESLRARLEREGSLPLENALQIAQQVLAALGYAHSHGVLHRDIKPENILLEGDQAVVADFGIARAVSKAGGERLTDTGMTLGTPAYMSPEQARAETNLDGRSDLYSVGCVLYEMLAGEPPFTGPTAQAVLARHAVSPVASLRTVRTTVPERLERTIERALAKMPADRFADAHEFAAALTQAASGESPGPVPAQPDRTRMHRRPMLIGAAALLLVVSGVLVARGGGGTSPSATDKARMLAVLPFKNLGAPADQYFADGLTEEISSRLAAVEDLGIISRTSADRYRNTNTPLKQIGRELGVSYVLEGSVRWEKRPDGTSRIRVTPQLIRVADDRHLWANRYDADLRDVFEVQSGIAEQVATALGVVIAAPAPGQLAGKPTTNLSAYDAYLRGAAAFPSDLSGSQGQTVMGLQRAAENYREAVALDSTFALAYAKLGSAAVRLYLYGMPDSSTAAEARAAIDRALVLAPGLSDAHFARGLYHLWIDRDTTRALGDLETALRQRPNDADVLMELAQTEWNTRGPRSQAIMYAERAVQLDPRTQFRLLLLAYLYRELQRFDEAERAYDRAIALRPENPGPYTQKAVIYLLRDGDIAGARRFIRRAAQHVDTMELISAAATSLLPHHCLGMLDEGYQQTVLTLPASAFGGDTAGYGIVKGMVYRARGDLSRFRAYFDTAFTFSTARLRQSPRQPSYLMIKAFALATRGARAQAYATWAQAKANSGERWFQSGELDARLAVMAGDYERALDVLEQRNWGTQLTLPWLRADPFWNPLRNYPRFQQLFKRPG